MSFWTNKRPPRTTLHHPCWQISHNSIQNVPFLILEHNPFWGSIWYWKFKVALALFSKMWLYSDTKESFFPTYPHYFLIHNLKCWALISHSIIVLIDVWINDLPKEKVVRVYHRVKAVFLFYTASPCRCLCGQLRSCARCGHGTCGSVQEKSW
jgi:hypothetical protein